MSRRSLPFLLSLPLLSACGAAPPAAVAPPGARASTPAETVQVHAPAGFAVGMVFSDERTSESELTIATVARRRKKSVSFVTSTAVDRREEVFAVEGGKITAFRVTYADYRDDAIVDGVRTKHVETLAGRSYRVTRKNGRFEVVRDDGSAVAEEEAELVRKDVLSKGPAPAPKPAPDAGDAPPPLPRFPERPLAVGEEVPGFAAYFASDADARDVHARVTRIERVDGQPAVAMAVTGTVNTEPQADALVRWSISGEVVVRARDAQEVAITLEGPATFEGSKDVNGTFVTMQGHGTLKTTWRRRFESEGGAR